MKGASYSSLMSGMVLGFSCHPQTILNYEKTLAEANKREVQIQIKEATKVRSHDPPNNLPLGEKYQHNDFYFVYTTKM